MQDDFFMFRPDEVIDDMGRRRVSTGIAEPL